MQPNTVEIMTNPQDVEAKARLLENGSAGSDSANGARASFQNQLTEQRKGIRHAQYLLMSSVVIGLLLGLAVASFCIKRGHTYPWMPHRLQRVFLLLFAADLLFFFVLPPIVLLCSGASRINADFGADPNREFASIIMLAICEFICGLWTSAMSAFSIYTGKAIAAKHARNGLTTLCSLGMVACIVFTLFGNPKFRTASRLNSRALTHEAELSVTGAIVNMVVALSAALALAQSSIPAHNFSVLGAAQHPIMFLGAFLLVKSVARLVTEFMQHRRATVKSDSSHRD